MKKIIIKTLCIILVSLFILGSTKSLAMTDENKDLILSPFRYEYGYALNTTGGLSRHRIYQIKSADDNKTNFYCLNALVGQTWLGGIFKPATYNKTYDLTKKEDIDLLKNESSGNEKYKYSQIANSQYLKQILWILDNIYIKDNNATAEENLAKKRALLERAGIVAMALTEEGLNGPVEVGTAYKYQPVQGYDYSGKLITNSEYREGYFYTDNEGKPVAVEMPDELVEVAQQTALWYFTNYLEGDEATKNGFDVKSQWDSSLVCSEKISESNPNPDPDPGHWHNLSGDFFDVIVKGLPIEVGKIKQEMTSILSNYLIDAANNYAENLENTTGQPLEMTSPTTNAEPKTINNADYYVVGPIKIEEKATSVYSLQNTIIVNGEPSTEAYISDEAGNNQNKTISNVIGQEFYITVPKSSISGNNIKIEFQGSYNTNEKKLWISTTATEQPIVEVTPGTKDIDLSITAPITPTEELDLALRKIITKIKGADGTEKLIGNEKKNLATRNLKLQPSDVKNIIEHKTAIYKHRKDPVVVEKGDIITYTLNVYNEGNVDGYASEITDQLPEGLEFVEPSTKILTGTVTHGAHSGETGDKPEEVLTRYECTYEPTTNKLVLKYPSNNDGEAIIPLHAYQNGDNLDYVSIPIECKVTGEPSTKAGENIYLTNIAYISKEHNSKTNTEVDRDRDSETTPEKSPNKSKTELVTTGDKYNGYKGKSSNPDVYSDTNNETHFEGMEDDDDFEIAVLLPKKFDLALRKYISSINSNGKEKAGREEPKINTKELASGTETTAEYTFEPKKEPLLVKQGDYVTYTFTVYNEGDIAGCVNKITDNIPTGLQFVYITPTQQGAGEKTLTAVDSKGNTEQIKVSDEIYNLISTKNMSWSLDEQGTTLKKDQYNGEETISITCDVKSYLGGTNKELQPYDSSKDNNHDGTGLDRVSVTVVLRVQAQNGSGVTIRNEAAITEAQDKDGKIQDKDDLTDRDSQTNQWPGKDGEKQYQDDEDYDHIKLGKVDLALKKFIAAVSDDMKIEDGDYLTSDKKEGSKTNPYTREPKVDTTELKSNPECHDAKYTLVKDPLVVPEQSYVVYNIRVYNEGEVDVYAGEVTDRLPEFLNYIDCDFNKKYGWEEGSDGKTISTSYLSHEKSKEEDNLLKAFDKIGDDGAGSKLDYRDLQILCRVDEKAPTETNITNIAEITKYEDEDGENIPEDIDSTPNNVDKKNEDDDDYEVVLIRKKKIDLALTKFITAVSDDMEITSGEYLTANGEEGSKTNPYTRATKVDTTELKSNPECHDAKYTLVKDPLTVPAQSYVVYNIRVYNEGEVDVYAGEVTDKLPEYLDYVECDFNKNYDWKVDSDGKTITTTYLSYEKDKDKNLLVAFDKKGDDGAGSGLDYRDLQILCRVNDKAPTNTNITNIAEITKYQDEDGKDITEDVDSTPNNVDKKNEDDDDYEVIVIKTFDLSLLKYVSQVVVTEDGVTRTTETGNTGNDSTDIVPKVEIHRKKVQSTIVKFVYTIKITNEGDIAGYAKEITDYVPEGLKFYAEDNEGWTAEGDNVIKTRLLENTLLQPGQSAEIKVTFRWINGSENLGLKTNIAEISEDYNDEGVPDRDSTPNNRKDGEDDIDDASVLLSIATGLASNIIKYTSITSIILAVIGIGIKAIKKYVL